MTRAMLMLLLCTLMLAFVIVLVWGAALHQWGIADFVAGVLCGFAIHLAQEIARGHDRGRP